MKKHLLNFLKRGLMAAAGGPAVLAIIYGSLGATGAVNSLDPVQICTEILTVTAMAFLAAGVGVVYEIEGLPLLYATMIHAAALYLDYLLIYLFNRWIPRDPMGIGIFTGIYAAGYGIVWLIVALSIKAKTARLNRLLQQNKS